MIFKLIDIFRTYKILVNNFSTVFIENDQVDFNSFLARPRDNPVLLDLFTRHFKDSIPEEDYIFYKKQIDYLFKIFVDDVEKFVNDFRTLESNTK